MVSFDDLVDDVVIDGKFSGNIKCRKLVVARTGHVVGNVMCDHLQLGGHIDGIVVCRQAEGNDQGYLHGSLYYQVPPKGVRISGIADYNDPPASVLSLIGKIAVEQITLPEIDVEADLDFEQLSSMEDGAEFVNEAEAEFDLVSDVDLVSEEPLVTPDEAAVEKEVFYNTPDKVVSILAAAAARPALEPAPEMPAPTGKVKLKASFF